MGANVSGVAVVLSIALFHSASVWAVASAPEAERFIPYNPPAPTASHFTPRAPAAEKASHFTPRAARVREVYRFIPQNERAPGARRFFPHNEAAPTAYHFRPRPDPYDWMAARFKPQVQRAPKADMFTDP